MEFTLISTVSPLDTRNKNYSSMEKTKQMLFQERNIEKRDKPCFFFLLGIMYMHICIVYYRYRHS